MAKKYFSPMNFMKSIPCLRASLNSGIYQTGIYIVLSFCDLSYCPVDPSPNCFGESCMSGMQGFVTDLLGQLLASALSVVEPQKAGGVRVESFGLGNEAV